MILPTKNFENEDSGKNPKNPVTIILIMIILRAGFSLPLTLPHDPRNRCLWVGFCPSLLQPP